MTRVPPAIGWRRLLGAWLAALVLMLASAAPGLGADAPPPDPLRLTRESAQYFQATGVELDQRVAALRAELDALRGQIPADQQAFLLPLIDEIGFALDRYRQAAAQTTPTPPPEKPFADRYSLQQLASVIEQADTATRAAQSLRREVERRRAALAHAQQAYDNAAVSYFRSREDDPDRLRAGLEMMRGWLSINAHRLELDERAARATIAEAVADRLRQEMRVAGERLVADGEDIATFARAAAAAKEEVEAQTWATDALRKQQPAAGDEIAAKQYEHALLQGDIKIAAARLDQSRQALLLALAHALVGEGGATASGEDVATRLRDRQRLLEEIRTALADWRASVDQDVALLNDQLATAEENDDPTAARWRAGLERARASADGVARLVAFTERGRELNDLAERVVAQQRGFFAAGWEKGKLALADIVANADHWASHSLFRLGDTPITLLGILQVAMTLAVAWWLSKFSTKGLRRVARDKRVSQSVVYTLSRLIRYAILAVGVVIGLSSIGFDLTHLAIVTGALGVGIGFGLQTIFNNFVSGLILLFERSIKVGDNIELTSGVTGQVREIDIRSTRVVTADGVDIVVPNSEFMETSVKNWTLSDKFRRLHVPFGVAYGSDKALVKKAVLEAADQLAFTHRSDPKRQPQVWMTSYGESSVNFELVVWLIPSMATQAAAALSAYLWAIDDAFATHGIELPFPQRDLHVRSAVPVHVVRDGGPAAALPRAVGGVAPG